MALGVYHKLWGMTSQYQARYSYGWYQVYRRLSAWMFPIVPAFFWYSFLAWEDPYKKLMTFGIFKRDLYFWDTKRSGGDTGWYS